MRTMLASLFLVWAIFAPVHAEKVETSFYDLEAQMTDQDGKSISLDYFRGHSVIVTMFFSSCPHACPMLIARLRSIEAKLTKEKRLNARFLLISFDPKVDTPAALLALQERHGVDSSRWRFATPKIESKISEIAAVLGIKYRKMPEGGYSHSSIFAVLDSYGKIKYRGEALQEDAEVFVEYLGK
ncbi:MAG: hypothetical protein COV44_04415 [Deltaproteobacteria bacterium CG11_big_fil_rev_8_21_14_0_20_45_16]|nr:MAG: hypothetical protein COV44_04415 [Deltaproteobacteria bacterium CG11_big_fil_rev_8_21_14_0_20_45_16]